MNQKIINKKLKVLLFLSVVMFIIPLVNAWSTNVLYNGTTSYTSESVSWNNNFERYLKIPTSVSILTNAYLNLTGLDSNKFYINPYTNPGVYVQLPMRNSSWTLYPAVYRAGIEINLINDTINKLGFQWFCDGTCVGDVNYTIRRLTDGISIPSFSIVVAIIILMFPLANSSNFFFLKSLERLPCRNTKSFDGIPSDFNSLNIFIP